jgi:hypothetical protein
MTTTVLITGANKVNNQKPANTSLQSLIMHL